MTASVSNTANSPGVASTDPGHVRVRRRSFWRVSLGGVLLFAAGAMVGFAPMRAWVFLRDDPKTVLISAIVVEADAKDVEGIREALKTSADDDRTNDLDPRTILESRPGTKTLAEPTLQTMVGESVTFFSGGEVFRGAEIGTRRFGFAATVDPEIRPSGNIELSYRMSEIPKIAQGVDGTIEIEEESIESTVVLRPDKWQAIEWTDRAASNADRARVRWIFFKVEPAD